MKDKNALIIGIRNEDSICFSIAKEIKKAGYNLYATYQDETTYDGVRRIAEELQIKKIYKYDARKDEDLIAFTDAIKNEGIMLDCLVHGISYSTDKGAKLNQPLLEIEWDEFTDAIRVGAFSLVEVCGKLLDVINEEGSILTLNLRWNKIAVPGFNVVCATKAALDSIVRGLAQSMGRAKKIRVNDISSGFVPTYSLGRVGNTLEILEKEKQRSPLKTNVRKEDIATLAISILDNSSLTGTTYTIDTGVDVVAN